MSINLIGAVLPRLAGLDMIITLSPYGKFPMSMDSFVSAGYKMTQPLGHIKSVFAMPGGGTTPGHIEDIINKFGNRSNRKLADIFAELKGSGNFGIKIYSNRKIGVYRIEMF